VLGNGAGRRLGAGWRRNMRAGARAHSRVVSVPGSSAATARAAGRRHSAKAGVEPGSGHGGGINLSVGLTTLQVVLAAWIFGLSKFASVIGSHVVAPLHLLLFIPFIDLGVHVFHTRKLPMDRRELEHLGHHPVRLLHEIWQWEWHALIIWGLLAAIAMPLLVLYLRRALIVLLRRHRTLVRSRPAVR
jgi:uncharacterized protein (DUF2062 family)